MEKLYSKLLIWWIGKHWCCRAKIYWERLQWLKCGECCPEVD